MKKAIGIWMIIAAVLGTTGSALGHFGMVIPSDNMVMQNDNRSVSLQLSFSHPMEMIGMELVKPKVFSVWANGKKLDLLDSIKPTQVMDHKAWQLDYQIKHYMVTQTIKADENGVFTYAVPKSGWWGCGALNEADFKLKTKSGEEKGVELGAVIWIHFEDWQQK